MALSCVRGALPEFPLPMLNVELAFVLGTWCVPKSIPPVNAAGAGSVVKLNGFASPLTPAPNANTFDDGGGADDPNEKIADGWVVAPPLGAFPKIGAAFPIGADPNMAFGFENPVAPKGWAVLFAGPPKGFGELYVAPDPKGGMLFLETVVEPNTNVSVLGGTFEGWGWLSKAIEVDPKILALDIGVLFVLKTIPVWLPDGLNLDSKRLLVVPNVDEAVVPVKLGVLF